MAGFVNQRYNHRSRWLYLWVVIIAPEESLTIASGANAQVYLSEETGDANLIAPGMVKFDAEGGSPLEPFSRTIAVDAVPPPCPPPEPEPRRVPRWLRAVAAVAVAVVVVAAVVVTGGAALAVVAKAAKVVKVGAAKKAVAAKKAAAAKAKAAKKAAANAAKKAKKFAKKHGKKKTKQEVARSSAVNAANEGIRAWEDGACARGIFTAMLGGAASGAVSGLFGGKNPVSRAVIKTVSNMAGTVTERLVVAGASEMLGLERGRGLFDDIGADFKWDAIFGVGFGLLEPANNLGLGDSILGDIFETHIKNEVKDEFKAK